MNYTKLNEPEHQDTPQDLLNSALIFARALSHLLEENEGVVVDVVGDIKLTDDVKKVIVFSYKDQINISMCEQDLLDGSFVMMDPNEEETEQ